MTKPAKAGQGSAKVGKGSTKAGKGSVGKGLGKAAKTKASASKAKASASKAKASASKGSGKAGKAKASASKGSGKAGKVAGKTAGKAAARRGTRRSVAVPFYSGDAFVSSDEGASSGKDEIESMDVASGSAPESSADGDSDDDDFETYSEPNDEYSYTEAYTYTEDESEGSEVGGHSPLSMLNPYRKESASAAMRRVKVAVRKPRTKPQTTARSSKSKSSRSKTSKSRGTKRRRVDDGKLINVAALLAAKTPIAAKKPRTSQMTRDHLMRSFFGSRTLERKSHAAAAERAHMLKRSQKSMAAFPLIDDGGESGADEPIDEDEVARIKSMFLQARASLRLSAVPATLPCRESQANELRSKIETSFLTRTGGSVFMGGLPGTGKTATVHEVVRELMSAAAAGSLDPFCYVEINAMELATPKHAYVAMARGVFGENEAPNQPLRAQQLLANEFKHAAEPREVATLMLVDEMDLLVTRKQTVLYNLFDWAASPNSRLFVVGIANTIDLPERMLPRVYSRLGVHIIRFPSYTVAQLETIVHSRLAELDAFAPTAIALCARKVASISGDARRALELCRRAAELAEADRESNVVTPAHIY